MRDTELMINEENPYAKRLVFWRELYFGIKGRGSSKEDEVKEQLDKNSRQLYPV